MESIHAARDYSKGGAGLALIVYENGRIRFEDYYNGHSANEARHIYSGTKSFFGVLAAIGVEEGWLDLDEPVGVTIEEWRRDPRKSRIIVRDLLNFSSGMESGYNQIYGRSSADKLKLSLGLSTYRDRGETFVYGPSHLQVFCEVLRRKLRDRGVTYEEYLEEKVIKPLGINIHSWSRDALGNPIPSAGMYLTARDWLKFGRMLADGGLWEGQKIIGHEGLQLCRTGTRINPEYGMTFWLNGYARQEDARVVDVEQWLGKPSTPTDWSRACVSKDAPADMITALGSYYQRLYVVESMNLAVVHIGGKGGGFKDAEFLARLFEGADTDSMTETAPPESYLPKVAFVGWKEKKAMEREERSKITAVSH